MTRKEKKTKKYRGSRSHGGGNAKNRRGSGNRGGFGNAGLNKHKKTWTFKYAKDYFGKRGFTNPNKQEIDTINLYEIENKIKNNEIPKDESGIYLFSFKGKILGSGELSYPVKISALSWSKKVEEKVKAAGGSLEKLA